MSQPVTITVRCRAFSGEGVRGNKVRVEGGEVSVWDSVAGHYTRCHDLSQSTQRRIVKLACRDA